MRSLLSAVLLASAFLGSAHADGDSLENMLGPREIAVGEAMRGEATGASAIGMNPAGLPLNRELVFEGGYGYRGTDQASMLGISACDSTNLAPGCFFYDYAGTNPSSELGSSAPLHRTTHIGGFALAHMVTPRIMLGSTLKYFHYATDVMSVPGDKSASGVNWDLGATIRLTEMLNIGVAGYNLWGTESIEMPRAVGGGIVVRPIPILKISYDMRWKLGDDQHGARYGGGAELFIRNSSGQTGFPIRLGALRDNALGQDYVSAGLGITTMTMGLDVGARRAIHGGDETLVLASVRLFGPRLAAPGVE